MYDAWVGKKNFNVEHAGRNLGQPEEPRAARSAPDPCYSLDDSIDWESKPQSMKEAGRFRARGRAEQRMVHSSLSA